jgi:hypothetical protein
MDQLSQNQSSFARCALTRQLQHFELFLADLL